MTSDNLFPSPLNILGVNVTPFDSYAHAAWCVEQAIRTRRKLFCVAINPEKIYRALHDPNLLDLLGRADMGICDGVGIVAAARILENARLARCTGVDLFMTLTAVAAEKGWRVFLLGASPDSNRSAYEKLLEKHPTIQIAGRRDGYFENSDEVVEEINAARPDLLFVAMGSPKQEYWIHRHRGQLEVPFCMGVGGTFDVLSGKVKRAPRFFRKTGTEFLYRLIQEPKRWRRQVLLPLFALRVFRARLLGGRSREVRA
ncbi:MAG: WecB/TagA/CpsF family glycosyltransferase [Phycisphaerae bacterium]|nr:WecB/TagA/CpsF family glycosyltransferase [Phycisphaerae bacterium]